MSNDQNILIIAPNFFEYEKKIAEAVQKAGYTVDLVSESVDNINIFFRLLTHYFPNSKLTKSVYDMYYSKYITANNKYVLVIRGGLLSKDIINKIRLVNADAKFILYQWDSVKLNPNALKIAEYFDEVCTFDINDSKKFGWRYVPLFHLDSNINNDNKKFITFIGSMHTKRAIIAKEIYKICQRTNDQHFVYIYTSFLSYIKQRFIKKNDAYKGVNISFLKFRSLPLNKVLEIYSQTKIMVDYTSPELSGYNIRTMESLSYKYKLVTNNFYIKDADFFDPNNIFVYDEDNFEIPEDFLKTEYKNLPNEKYNKYSLSNWVSNILGERTN